MWGGQRKRSIRDCLVSRTSPLFFLPPVRFLVLIETFLFPAAFSDSEIPGLHEQRKTHVTG